MDCIFKVWGYVPKHRFCTHCQPLENILKPAKHDRKKRSEAINLILRTYTALKADDVLRDEKSGIRRAFAWLIKRFCSLRLPDELNRIVEKADRTIRDLESPEIHEEEYIEHISEIGGEVFEASLGDRAAFSIGETLSAAITIHDMIKDLREDRERSCFNPLRAASYDKIAARMSELSSTIQTAFPQIRPPTAQNELRILNPHAGLMAQGCSESINVCIGVCLGICSALALYRCCCG